MKIVVLLKQTPNTEATISVSGDSSSIDKSGIKFIVNPYDEFAIEEALKIKAASGDCEVVIASFSDASVKEQMLKALGMGADRALVISNEGLEAADSLTVAKVLAAAVKGEAPDMVLCGRQGIDDDNMHVGVMTAELLGWPHVNVVSKMETAGDKVTVEREVEGGQTEVYDVTLPAVFGAHKALNKPRYASLPGIMKAKKKPYETKSVGDIGLDAGELSGTLKTKIESFSYPPEKPAGKVFKDESAEVMAQKVLELLREEAKVI